MRNNSRPSGLRRSRRCQTAKAPIVHTDDFSTGEPGVEWWPRFEAEVVVPLSEGRPARYRRYDWPTRRLAEWHTVEPAPVVILEGVSSARTAVSKVITLAIWVDAPEDIRLTRGLERDGEEARPLWTRWMAQEDAHFAKDNTRPAAIWLSTAIHSCPTMRKLSSWHAPRGVHDKPLALGVRSRCVRGDGRVLRGRAFSVFSATGGHDGSRAVARWERPAARCGLWTLRPGATPGPVVRPGNGA